MLVVWQTAAFQPRMWLTGDLVLEHLYQATLANAGLPAEHHDLSLALFGVRPAFQQQRHLRFTSNQWGQATGGSGIQPALGATGTPHAIHGHRLRQAAQRLCP
jgi:hypothetical protein